MFPHRLQTLFLAALLLSAGADAATDDHNWPAPRYDWRTGDHYVYERRQVTEFTNSQQPRRVERQQVQVWCIQRRDNQALLLLELAQAHERTAHCIGGLSLSIDPRGRKHIAPEWFSELERVQPLLEVLPEFGETARGEKTYLTQPGRFGTRYRCTEIGPDAQQHGHIRIDLQQVDPTGVSGFLRRERNGSIWFSQDAQVVTRAAFTETDGRTGVRRQSVVTLYAKYEKPKSWCGRRRDERERFLRTMRLEQHALSRLLAQPDHAETILRDVLRYWEETGRELADTQSPLRRFVQVRRDRRLEQVDDWRERARLAAQWLGRRAADWSLQDLDGRTRRSEEFRDRPVLEVFWKADAAESLRSFQVLRRLREAVSEDRLRIVCINLDQDVAEAARAAGECGAGFVHVLAGPPVGSDPLAALPVFRLLDGTQRVVGVRFGWRPSLLDFVEPALAGP